jgi:hypothetical protein
MRRLAKPSLTQLTVVLAGLGIIVAAVFLGVRSWPSDTLDAATVLAKSDGAEAEILAQATEGTVLYCEMEEYLRQGPAAPLVEERRKNDFYVPEWSRAEMWSLVGPAGRIARVYGRMTDEEDRLVQEVTTDGNEVVTRAPASGAEERWPLDWSVKDMAADVGADVRELQEDVATGEARIVGYSGGSKTIIVELLRVEEPPPPEPDVRGYTLPYTLDLDSVERVMREEVHAETFLPYRWWMVAVDAAGEEHLVWDLHMVYYKVVDPATAPAQLFGGR